MEYNKTSPDNGPRRQCNYLPDVPAIDPRACRVVFKDIHRLPNAQDPVHWYVNL